ncbi:MAG TPA: hypothetical protein VFV66_35255 [Nonomuraea sp.]|nr:hypothetical protein [Nonomuraea sp.]
MAEMAVPDGSWAFNGEVLRIVPGSDKDVRELHRTLGEVVVPRDAPALPAPPPPRALIHAQGHRHTAQPRPPDASPLTRSHRAPAEPRRDL